MGDQHFNLTENLKVQHAHLLRCFRVDNSFTHYLNQISYIQTTYLVPNGIHFDSDIHWKYWMAWWANFEKGIFDFTHPVPEAEKVVVDESTISSEARQSQREFFHTCFRKIKLAHESENTLHAYIASGKIQGPPVSDATLTAWWDDFNRAYNKAKYGPKTADETVDETVLTQTAWWDDFNRAYNKAKYGPKTADETIDETILTQSESVGSVEVARMDRKYTRGPSAEAQLSFTKLQHDAKLSLDESYQALTQKFGLESIAIRTFKRWWEKLSIGDATFASTGRPSFRVPSEDSSKQMELDEPTSSQQIIAKPAKSFHSTTSSNRSALLAAQLSQRIVVDAADEDCHDDYTDCLALFGDRDIEHDLDLGIDRHAEKIKRARDALGRFVTTKDSCVFCQLPIYSLLGYGVLSCGHAFHWDSTYADWSLHSMSPLQYFFRVRGGYRICPKKECAKEGVAKNCTACKKDFGLGQFETMCYCQNEIAQSDLHADCLQNRLANNAGLCASCNKPHPGFCIRCKQVFSLTATTEKADKVYRKCCHTYAHRSCWELKPETSCPYGCVPFQGIIYLPHISLCGVNTPLHELPAIGKPRGIIGGRPSGCKKPELYGKSPACVLCNSALGHSTFLYPLQCGHMVHLRKEFVDWVNQNPDDASDYSGANCYAACPKCGKEPFRECVKCPIGCGFPNGEVQLQFQCTLQLCSYCYRDEFIKSDGKCILFGEEKCKRRHTFCVLCCDFIAFLPDGQPNDYHRLAGPKEPAVSCRFCKYNMHKDHYIDWVTRFNTTHCPLCRQLCGRQSYIVGLPHIQYTQPSFSFKTSAQSITYIHKQYPLLKTEGLLRGVCLLCDKIIGYKMKAAFLCCCNAFFHVPHLENWIKRVGQSCPNCGREFGSFGHNNQLFIIEPAKVIPDMQITARVLLAGVKQCCKNLIPRFQLEQKGWFCADCDFCLDTSTLEPKHHLGFPERHCETSCRWSTHICSYCKCLISLGAQPIFLDCGHFLHYTCGISWALSEDPVFINNKQDTYRAEHCHEPDYLENLLSTPNIFKCLTCGYHQEYRVVMDYDHREHNSTAEQKLSTWKTFDDIMEYRREKQLIPFIGTKEIAPGQKQRWVCRLCGGDITDTTKTQIHSYGRHDFGTCQAHKIHNHCFKDWVALTNCNSCQETFQRRFMCSHCSLEISSADRYEICDRHTIHYACTNSWIASRKCYWCAKHIETPSADTA